MPEPKTINVVINTHGERVSFTETAYTTRRPDVDRIPQWFGLESGSSRRLGFPDRTDLYFTNNIFSERAGGCTTLATSIYKRAKICKDFDKYIGKRSKSDTDAMKYEWDVYEGKRSGPLLPIKHRLAFASTSPAEYPKFDSRDCVPNMELEGDWAGKYPPGIYLCTEQGLELIKEITKSYLHKEVAWCEINAPVFGNAMERPFKLNIFVFTCTKAWDKDNNGQTLPFLRSARSTRDYDPKVMTPYDKKCDKWGEQRLEVARFFKNRKQNRTRSSKKGGRPSPHKRLKTRRRKR
tara:strand:- start:451 stop:1329 length:879 start_codon:yes stop_codon:yes gene_type:complete